MERSLESYYTLPGKLVSHGQSASGLAGLFFVTFAVSSILAKAHTKLDRAIDKLYSKIPFTSDAECVALLLSPVRTT